MLTHQFKMSSLQAAFRSFSWNLRGWASSSHSLLLPRAENYDLNSITRHLKLGLKPCQIPETRPSTFLSRTWVIREAAFSGF